MSGVFVFVYCYSLNIEGHSYLLFTIPFQI